METQELSPLLISGSGYTLTIAPEAIVSKQQLIARAAEVTQVTTNSESALAQFEIRSLARTRNQVEKSRKEIKEPILNISKEIDAVAKKFMIELLAEEQRLSKLVNDHALEVHSQKQEALKAERVAFITAEKSKLAAAQAQKEEIALRASKPSIAELLAAKGQAETAIAQANLAIAARLESSAIVIETRTPEGVRFVVDFEIINIHELYKSFPAMVALNVKRGELIACIKQSFEETERLPEIPGLRIFRRPNTLTR